MKKQNKILFVLLAIILSILVIGLFYMGIEQSAFNTGMGGSSTLLSETENSVVLEVSANYGELEGIGWKNADCGAITKSWTFSSAPDSPSNFDISQLKKDIWFDTFFTQANGVQALSFPINNNAWGLTSYSVVKKSSCMIESTNRLFCKFTINATAEPYVDVRGILNDGDACWYGKPSVTLRVEIPKQGIQCTPTQLTLCGIDQECINNQCADKIISVENISVDETALVEEQIDLGITNSTEISKNTGINETKVKYILENINKSFFSLNNILIIVGILIILILIILIIRKRK